MVILSSIEYCWSLNNHYHICSNVGSINCLWLAYRAPILNSNTAFKYCNVFGYWLCFLLLSTQIFVNGESAPCTLQLNNGVWHHVVINWQSEGGRWSVYVDGYLLRQGSNLATGTSIPSGGHLIIGQTSEYSLTDSWLYTYTFLLIYTIIHLHLALVYLDQFAKELDIRTIHNTLQLSMSCLTYIDISGQDQDKVGGGFNSRESFVGELSQVYFFHHILSQEEIQGLIGWHGNIPCPTPDETLLSNAVMKWTDVLDHIKGNVLVRNSSLCQGEYRCLRVHSACSKVAFSFRTLKFITILIWEARIQQLYHPCSLFSWNYMKTSSVWPSLCNMDAIIS